MTERLEQTPLPDHPVRRERWYQLVNRLPRPLLNWVGIVAAIWALGLDTIVGHPLDDSTRLIVLGFVGGLYGVHSWEKKKGLA